VSDILHKEVSFKTIGIIKKADSMEPAFVPGTELSTKNFVSEIQAILEI